MFNDVWRGEQGERSIEIRARKMLRNSFFVEHVGLLKMQHPLLVVFDFKKKKKKKHQFWGHFASGVFVISSGTCIINRRICERWRRTDAPVKASCVWFTSFAYMLRMVIQKRQLLTGAGEDALNLFALSLRKLHQDAQSCRFCIRFIYGVNLKPYKCTGCIFEWRQPYVITASVGVSPLTVFFFFF